MLQRSNELLAEAWSDDPFTAVTIHYSVDGVEFSLPVMQGWWLAYDEIVTQVL